MGTERRKFPFFTWWLQPIGGRKLCPEGFSTHFSEFLLTARATDDPPHISWFVHAFSGSQTAQQSEFVGLPHEPDWVRAASCIKKHSARPHFCSYYKIFLFVSPLKMIHSHLLFAQPAFVCNHSLLLEDRCAQGPYLSIIDFFTPDFLEIMVFSQEALQIEPCLEFLRRKGGFDHVRIDII